MNLLDQLERRFRRFAVPNVTLALIICQILVYGLVYAPGKPDQLADIHWSLLLIPERVLAGEGWRLITFLAVPPLGNIICALFFWYLFYLMGTALENHWGTFRYNVYLLVGYVATVAASFLAPNEPSSNAFMQGSVFLAFAFLYPDFELYIFFLLPVKIKWFARLTWLSYGIVMIVGDWLMRALVLASVCNFLLFFGKEIVARVRGARRRMAAQAARLAVRQPAYFHCCTICGITDRTHPKMEFRYCSKCVGTYAYCEEHLRDHEHLTDVRQTT